MRNIRNTDKSQIASLFSEFVNKNYLGVIKSRIEKTTNTNEESGEIFPLIIHFSYLCEFSTILSQHLLSSPLVTLSIFNETLHCIIEDLYDNGPCFTRCVVRVISLPPVSEVFRSTIPQSDFVGRFFALQCTVTRVGAIQVMQLDRTFSCSKCGHLIKSEADFNQFCIIRPPRRCTNIAAGCNSTIFNVVTEDSSSVLYNFQEIRVNERFTCLSIGRMPKSITCCLDADLVDTVRPGDDVIINGILIHRWRTPKVGLPCEIETILRANSIENLSEMRFRGELGGENSTLEMGKRFNDYWYPATSRKDFKMALRLRDDLVRSICPDIYGLYLVKLSLALVLVGAPPRLDKAGGDNEEANRINLAVKSKTEEIDKGDFRVRGNLHLLLMGEPSTAKSALLRASCRLAGRVIFTSATGTTAAGLTAAAVRDSSGWALEAGALVLADGGVCAIDEFASLRGTDRAAVHEAMEQQTVSLAKAGLVAQLNCRCAVIAASSLSVDAENCSDLLPTPLLSRFDLVWRLYDPIGNEAWDSSVAGHILGNKAMNSETGGLIVWTTEELRNYISWVRGEFHPQLSGQAAILLQRYYELRRRKLQIISGAEEDQAVAGRTTLRLLESLIRLTQAHARLMARNITIVEDAVMAIWLMDCSIQSTFGRSASAIEVSGHCLSREETVTRHNMENSFEDILSAVFDELDLRFEDMGTEWTSFSTSPIKLAIEPVCASTQVNDDTSKALNREITSADMSFSSQNNEYSSILGIETESFNKTENAFDFDVDRFMPSGLDVLDKLDDLRTLKSTECIMSQNIGDASNLTTKENSNKRGVRSYLKSETNIGSANKVMVKNPKSSQQTTESPDSNPKKNVNEVPFASRLRFKFSEFAFTEGSVLLPESPTKKETVPDRIELNNSAEAELKPTNSTNQSKCLNFLNLAPEDWSFANIDTDFDL